MAIKREKMSTYQKGKKFAEDSGYRREMFVSLLRHIEGGYSLDSFEECSDDSIRKYLKLYKEEWNEEELSQAQRKGKGLWESIGFRQANGECIGNSRSWYYNMANRYGWREKLDIEAEHKGQVQVQVVSYASQKSLDSSKDKGVT